MHKCLVDCKIPGSRIFYLLWVVFSLHCYSLNVQNSAWHTVGINKEIFAEFTAVLTILKSWLIYLCPSPLMGNVSIFLDQ